MTASAVAPTATVGVKPVLATIVGIPVVVIVLAAADGRPVPIVGSYSAGLVALFVLGSVMCGWGLQAMAARYGYLRATLVGGPLGVLNLALIASGLLGWAFLLGPATAALGSAETVSPERAAIVSVGAVMALKWAVAWLVYLPRGPVGAQSGG